jgi:tetratricopeptide (TPR) repeat protein
MMKYLFFTFAILAAFCSLAQQPAPSGKGANPLATPLEGGEGGVTRAVVIGISDYADDRIPDLRFAHADATAFAGYLGSTAGGSLTNERIICLTNKDATAGKIIAAFDWLIAESKPGDRALIYFSGHGDVERLTKFQRGYLLCYDAPGTTYMAGGSLAVGSLEDIITTLSESSVQVVMISDACRSGKLAGSANGGTQATTASLAQQFSKEIKILSCQPEEFSLEGEQWGGGRGCFSFHLVDALTGLADANADGSVNLLETGRYLEEKIPAETAPHNQIPMTVGNKSAALATVQPDALAALRQRRTGTVSTLSPIDARGFEDMVLTKTDTSVQRLYAAFTAALERGDLMSPPNASANFYYEQLLQQPGIEKLKGLITRNLAAALQDEAQVVINQLLRTDPAVVDDAFSPAAKYDHLPGYLRRAAALLGTGHYMYRFIKAREYFFSSKTYRKENYPTLTPDSLYSLTLTKLDTALLFDEEAAYVWFEKGYLLCWNSAHYEQAVSCFEKASLLSTQWILPKYYHGKVLGVLTIDELKLKGIDILKKVISEDSLFLPAYREIGVTTNEGIWFETYIRKMQEYEQANPDKVPATYYNYLGSCLMGLERYGEAVQALQKGATISNHRHPLIYVNLGRAYGATGDYENAEKAYEKALDINPLFGVAHGELGFIQLNHLNRPPQTVKQHYLLATRMLPNNLDILMHIILLDLQAGLLDSAELVAREWLAHKPDDIEPHLALGYVYTQQGLEDEAKQVFRKALSFCTEEKTDCMFNKLIALNALGEQESFENLREKMRLAMDNTLEFNACLAIVHAFCDQYGTALEYFEKAFQEGNPEMDGDLWFAFYHPVTFRLRQTPEFRELLKKYHPGLVKD